MLDPQVMNLNDQESPPATLLPSLTGADNMMRYFQKKENPGIEKRKWKPMLSQEKSKSNYKKRRTV